MEIYWSNHIINGLAFILTVHEIGEHLSRCRHVASCVNVRLPYLVTDEEELKTCTIWLHFPKNNSLKV